MTSKGKGKAKVTKKVNGHGAVPKSAIGRLREERRAFLDQYGKTIKAAWEKAGEHPKAMAVWAEQFKKDMPCRMFDYATVALGLRTSNDKVLLRWVEQDKVTPKAGIGQATLKQAGKLAGEVLKDMKDEHNLASVAASMVTGKKSGIAPGLGKAALGFASAAMAEVKAGKK